MTEERLRLSGAVTTRVEGASLLFYGDQVLRVDACPPSLVTSLPILRAGFLMSELEQLVDDHRYLEDFLGLLSKCGFLVRAPSADSVGTTVERQVEYWAARQVDGDVAQQRIASARIAVLGLGGIGSVVLEHLLGAGVRQFILIDGDCVELHNLNRQFLYRPEQVGKPKTEAAACAISSRAADVSMQIHTGFVKSVNDLNGALEGISVDLLVLAADKPVGEIRLIALSWCMAHAAAFIEGGCGLRQGSWGPLLRPEETAQYMRIIEETRHLPLPEDVMRASFGPSNTLIAAHMAYDILVYLVGLPAHSAKHQVTLDFDRCTLRRFPILER